MKTDQIQSEIRHRMLAYWPGCGLMKQAPATIENFFQAESESRCGPEHWMEGGRTLGWMWPCGSVYLESASDRDPEVAALEKRYLHRKIVVSLAGAPHTLSIDEAMSLYRERGWYRTKELSVTDVERNESGMVFLYRPTIVIHPMDEPKNPIAIATGELRVEQIGADAILVSAVLTGLAVLDKRTPRAAGYFVAQVLSMHLGDTSKFNNYEKKMIKDIVVVSNVQVFDDCGNVPPEVAQVVLQEFEEYFQFRTINENDIWDPGQEEKSLDPLFNCRFHRVSNAADASVLARKARIDIVKAVSKFAEARKRHGLSNILANAQNVQNRVEESGILLAMRQAVHAEVNFGTVSTEHDIRSMSHQYISVVGGPLKSSVNTGILRYRPSKDHLPYETWNESTWGILDTLELIRPGSTLDEGCSELHRGTDLDYPEMPAECLILRTPNRRVTKGGAEYLVAALLLAAAAKEVYPDTMVIWELASDEPGEKFGVNVENIEDLLFKIGFKRSSEEVYALPRAHWRVISTTAQQLIAGLHHEGHC